jgi:hypothetical protein
MKTELEFKTAQKFKGQRNHTRASSMASSFVVSSNSNMPVGDLFKMKQFTKAEPKVN